MSFKPVSQFIVIFSFLVMSLGCKMQESSVGFPYGTSYQRNDQDFSFGRYEQISFQNQFSSPLTLRGGTLGLDEYLDELIRSLRGDPYVDFVNTDQYDRRRREQRAQQSQAALNRLPPALGLLEFLFVQIPAGHLPGLIPVDSFEALRMPVSQELWEVVMGDDSISNHTPVSGIWRVLSRVPVTQVAWEQEDGSAGEIQDFLHRLNALLLNQNCTYDLPTDHQLWYLIRGDSTGLNEDLYSAGVNDENILSYVMFSENWHSESQSNGRFYDQWLHSNVFGVYLGNVRLISKDPYDSDDLRWGRSVRGASRNLGRESARSERKAFVAPGVRSDDTGFTLVRTCH